LTNNLS